MRPDGNEPILSNIHIDIEEGEMVAILGPSGSGKTTLLRCLHLQEKWDEGKLFFNGEDMFSKGWWARRIIRRWTFIKEKPTMSPSRTVMKNVLLGSRRNRPIGRLLTGTISMEEKELAMDYINKVGLLLKDHYRVEQLSGGEVKRLALAKAFAQKEKVVLADEPVSNIDPHTANSIMKDIRTICQAEAVTFICVLHQVEIAEKYATRMIGLKDGQIAFDVQGRRLTQLEKNML